MSKTYHKLSILHYLSLNAKGISSVLSIAFILFILIYFKMGIIYAETSFSEEYVQVLDILSKGVENISSYQDLQTFIRDRININPSNLSTEQISQLKKLLNTYKLEEALNDLKRQSFDGKSYTFFNNLNNLIYELRDYNNFMNSVKATAGFLGVICFAWLGELLYR